MTEEKIKNDCDCGCEYCSPRKNWRGGGVAGGGVYGFGFIGAVIYYIGHAATFGAGVLGFLKAIVWPAILIYKVLGMLNM